MLTALKGLLDSESFALCQQFASMLEQPDKIDRVVDMIWGDYGQQDAAAKEKVNELDPQDQYLVRVRHCLGELRMLLSSQIKGQKTVLAQDFEEKHCKCD